MDILKKLETNFATQQHILKLISNIDLYKGKWMAVEQSDNRYLKELRKIATIESIGSSTRIEGVMMTDKEIKSLLKSIKGTRLKTRDEQEVFGYYEALEIIHENASDMELSESTIKNLHNILLKHSSKDKHHKGKYKALSNKVVANYSDGKQRIIFSTTEPHLTPVAMFDLVTWTNRQIEQQKIHSLLLVATFVYEFLSIHPFQDGNGRLSRLITTLLLLKTDYVFVQYVSFENIIEKKKKKYYEALMTGQKNRNTSKEKIGEWVVFFLECLQELTEKLDEKYSNHQAKGGYINDRQKRILNYIKLREPLKLNDITQKLSIISPNTIKKDLQYLKAENLIESIGNGRGTMYVLKVK